MDNWTFATAKEAIASFTTLVKEIVAVIKSFIDSWKKEIKFFEDGEEITLAAAEDED